MARLPNEADPEQLVEGGGPSTTEERVIGSLLEGLDGPQPVVRTRAGRAVNAPETTPPHAAPGDRHGRTALLPDVESRQKRRATYFAAAIGILAIVLAIAYVRRSADPADARDGDGQPAMKNANVAAQVDLSSNHQMNNSGTAAGAGASSASVASIASTASVPPMTATAPMPTVSLSSLPSAPIASAVTAAPAMGERPHPPAHASSGNHAEIREDSL